MIDKTTGFIKAAITEFEEELHSANGSIDQLMANAKEIRNSLLNLSSTLTDQVSKFVENTE